MNSSNTNSRETAATVKVKTMANPLLPLAAFPLQHTHTPAVDYPIVMSAILAIRDHRQARLNVR